MKVSKWVDMGQEVDVEISVEDIRCALAEAFSAVTEDRLGEPGPSRQDIARALNLIAQFLKALTDGQIDMLTFGQRFAIEKFLSEQTVRFRLTTENAPGAFA